MTYLNESQKRLNDLYIHLRDLKQAKKLLENAMHYHFYEREVYHKLYVKLKKVNEMIKQTKTELEKARKEENEKSRQIV